MSQKNETTVTAAIAHAIPGMQAARHCSKCDFHLVKYRGRYLTNCPKCKLALEMGVRPPVEEKDKKKVESEAEFPAGYETVGREHPWFLLRDKENVDDQDTATEIVTTETKDVLEKFAKGETPPKEVLDKLKKNKAPNFKDDDNEKKKDESGDDKNDDAQVSDMIKKVAKGEISVSDAVKNQAAKAFGLKKPDEGTAKDSSAELSKSIDNMKKDSEKKPEKKEQYKDFWLGNKGLYESQRRNELIEYGERFLAQKAFEEMMITISHTVPTMMESLIDNPPDNGSDERLRNLSLFGESILDFTKNYSMKTKNNLPIREMFDVTPTKEGVEIFIANKFN